MRVSHRKLVITILAFLLLVPAYAAVVADEALANSLEQGLVVNDDPVNYTPNVLNGRVYAITTVGNKVIVGGTFTQVRAVGSPTTLTRNYIFAFDKNTGAIDTGFVPVLNGEVETLEPAGDGTSVFVGGSFSTVNGVSNFGITKLNVNTGAMVPGFTASTAGKVRDIGLHGNTLYLGGDIWSVNGVPRNRLAAINATTGAVDSSFTVGTTAPRVSVDWVSELDVSPDGSEMVIIGNFTEVDNLPRTQIARIDLTGPQAQVMDWSTNQYAFACSSVFWTYTRDVEYSLDSDYFVVATTGGPWLNTLCDTAARWETSASGSGQLETWADWSGGDTLTAVAISDVAVYIGGHQRWMNNHLGRDSAQPGAVSREGIAALDPINGVPLSWNPGKDRGVAVWDLHLSDLGLYAGSDTDFAAGEYHAKLAQWPLSGGTPVPLAVADPLPTTMFTGESTGSLTQRSFTGSTFGSESTVPGNPISWGSVADGFIEAGKLYYVQSGTLRSRTYDGSSFGSEVTEPSWTSWTNLTAAGWYNGRLYYVDSTSSSLRYRYFSLESGLVGSQTFTLSTGISFTNIAGLDFAGDKMFYARTDGNLWVVNVTASGVPISGTEQIVSGPGAGDGMNWADPALFFLTDDGAPSVTLTSPADGAVVDGTVALTADADDPEGIDQVEFFVDGSSVGVDADPTGGWSVNWDSTSVSDGATTVSATATDSAGKTVSDGHGITVDNQGPTVSITSPNDGATVSGVVGVSADATDVVGVDDVEFFVNGNSIGVDSDGGDGWSVPWDTSGVSGAATVSATATDTSGNTDSDSVDVTVDNSGGAEVLYVVGNAGSLNSGETAIVNRLQGLGYTVTVMDDDSATAGDASGKALVIVSSSINAATGNTWRDVAQPVWMGKPWSLDDLGMTGPTGDVDYGIVSTATVDITSAGHDMAAGLSGTVTILPSARLTSFGLPGPGATVIAEAQGLPTTFVYQPGAALVGGGTAAGCRLTSSIYQSAPASYTADGWALFDAAAQYAVSNCSAVPPTDGPPTVSVTDPTDGASVSGTVSITADATDDNGVTQVEFFVDGSSIGVDTDGGDGWSASWDTTSVADGTHTIGATATDTIDQTGDDSVSVAVTNTSAGVVLFVAGNAGSLNTGEAAVVGRLEGLGYTVSVMDDNDATAGDATGTALVIVSSTINAGTAGTWANTPEPVWMAKPWGLDDLGMTGPTGDVDYGFISTATVDITDSGHDMAAGLTGTVTILPSARLTSFGVPGAGATVIAEIQGMPTTFVYQPGAALVGGGAAPGCRLTSSLYQTAPASFTADAWALFEAAVAYATGGCQ